MNRVATSVRIVNPTSTEFTDRYDSQRYVIPAGSEIIAPYDAAALWLGDPALYNFGNAPTERERTNELHRVQRRCGYHDGLVFVEGGDPDGTARDWDEFRPQLQVFTTGPDAHRLLMVGEAPDDSPVNIFSDPGAEKSSDQKLYEMQQQLDALISRAEPGALDTAIENLAMSSVPAPEATRPDSPPVDSPSRPKAPRTA